MPAGVAVRLLTPLLKLGRRDDAWPDLAKPSLDADLFLSVVPMSAHMGVRRGQGAAGELNKHVGEQPSSSKLVSLYRMPPSKKKGRKKKARLAAQRRWAPEAVPAAPATVTADDSRTVQWGNLCTQGAMAGATHALEHLRAMGVLKAMPRAGSVRFRAVAAAVLAAELGGPEHDQLGAAELSKLAFGFAHLQR